MRIGFLMDPLDGVRVDHDSTFALMLECQRRGWSVPGRIAVTMTSP